MTVVHTAEATGLSDDLTNVLSSLEIPILLLGRDSKIRRFAPAAARVLQLGPGDIGRALCDIDRTLALASAELAAQVLVQLGPFQRTLQDESGRWYQLTARPYLTLDGSIDGTVIVAFDVDSIQRATEDVAAAQRERAQQARQDSERRIADYQEKLRQMAFDAAIGEERERRRIAADLHDRIGQSLALAQMKLKSVQRSGSRLSAVDETIALLAQSITDTRTLIFELSPPILYELGLKEALSWLAEDLGKRSGLRIVLSDDAFAQPLHDATAAILYRAVQELLTNVIKHARAPSAKVSLRRSADQVEIDVEDTGIGFDPQAAAHASAPGGFGLFSVREQLHRLGGTMEVASGERRGTRVSLRLPLDREPSAPPRPAT